MTSVKIWCTVVVNWLSLYTHQYAVFLFVMVSVIYYSCELYTVYHCLCVCVFTIRSFAACMWPLNDSNYFSSCKQLGQTTVMISSCLQPFVCPCQSTHPAWRVSNCELALSSGGCGQADRGYEGERDRRMQVSDC